MFLQTPDDSREQLSTDRRSLKPSQWAAVPYWFAATAGLIYAAGFLIEFTFQHAMGITQSLDVFKGKYIYIGLQSLLFPASVMLLLFGYWRTKSKELEISATIEASRQQYLDIKNAQDSADQNDSSATLRLDELKNAFESLEKDGFRASFAFVVAMIGLLSVFYLTTTFLRPQDWSKMQPYVAGLSLGIMLLMSLIRVAERPVERAIAHIAELTEVPLPKRKLKLGTTARAILLVPEFAAIGLICWPQIQLFAASFADGGYFYVLFVFLVFLMLAFLLGVLPVFQKHNRGGALLAMNLSVTFSFLYLSILSYAYHIYPYLPTSRGGGDYSADPRVCIFTFAVDSIESIPDALIDNHSLQSKPLTLLEETPSLAFVTPEHTIVEREKWRMVGIENKPKVIYTLQRDAIVSVSFQTVSGAPKPSPTPYAKIVPSPVAAMPPTTAPTPTPIPIANSPTPTPVVIQQETHKTSNAPKRKRSKR